MQRRQPGRRTSTCRPGETVTCTFTNRQARPDRDRQGRRARRRRRTSASPPAAASAPRASSSTTTPTPRCRTRAPSPTSRPAAGYSRGRDRAGRLGPDQRHLQRRQPGLEHRRQRRRDRHLHVHQPQARPDRGRQGRPAQRRPGLRLHGGRRPVSPSSFSLDDDADATLSNTRTFTDVVPRQRLLARRDRARPAGTRRARRAATAARSRTSTSARRDRHLHVHEPASAGSITVVQGRHSRRPAGLRLHGRRRPAARRASRSTTTRTATLSNTRTFSERAGRAAATRSRRPCPRGWDQTARDLQTTAARSRTSTSRAGENVTCTFTNRKRGQIVVVKDAHARRPAGLRLHGRRRPAARRASSSTTTPNGDAVEHADVRERGAGLRLLARRRPCRPAGTRPRATCNDGSPVSNIDVAAGETVTCTFANRKRGQIVVVKDAQPNDAQDFAFTAGGGLSPTSFSLDDDSDGTLSNTRTFANVAAGSRLLAGRDRAGGWDRRGADLQRRQPGREHRRGRRRDRHLHVHQPQARHDHGRQGRDAQRRAGLRLHGGRRPEPGELLARRRRQRDAARTRGRSRTCVPGSGYSVSETVPAGWDQTSATCDDGSPVSNINVAPGENVTCTFTNRKRGQIVVVKDATPDDAQDFDFTAGGGLSPRELPARRRLRTRRSRTRGRSRTSSPAPATRSPRPCPTGWDQTRATCNDGSPVSNIDVAPGETVTCTFANRKRGQIVVVKDATPDDPQDFDFTAGGGLSARRASSSTTTPNGDAVQHADVRQRGAGRRLLAGRDRADRLGPDQRHL